MTNRAIDPRLARVAVALAFVGGYVDAVGFVALARVFTGHITGNTVMLAIDLAEGTSTDVFRRLLAVAMFLAGLVLAAIVNARLVRRGSRSRFAPVLALEALLLAPLMFGDGAFTHKATQGPPSSWTLFALVALAATALGLQNGMLRKVGEATVHTTYISGAVTKLTEGLLARWFRRRDRAHGRSSRPARGAADADAPPRAELVMLAGVALAFAAGAICGVALYLSGGLVSLLVPVVLLLTVALVDAKRPLEEAG